MLISTSPSLIDSYRSRHGVLRGSAMITTTSTSGNQSEALQTWEGRRGCRERFRCRGSTLTARCAVTGRIDGREHRHLLDPGPSPRARQASALVLSCLEHCDYARPIEVEFTRLAEPGLLGRHMLAEDPAQNTDQWAEQRVTGSLRSNRPLSLSRRSCSTWAVRTAYVSDNVASSAG